MTFAQNVNPTYVKQPNNGSVQIANADAQNQKTVYTAAANGTKVIGLIGVSTDTSARDVQVSRTNGGTSFPYGTVSIPAGAGNSSTVPSVDMFAGITGLPRDSDGQAYVLLQSGDTLTVSALSTVTSGKLITCQTPAAGDF